MISWDSVSIPIGFSSSLQRPFCRAMRMPGTSFNPYRVFKFVATSRLCHNSLFHQSFQSLSGFQVRCNFWENCRDRRNNIRFQSLSGFQVRCNSEEPGLRPAECCSFNPYRVFKFVATVGVLLIYTLIVLFQSLSGFQVRCNSYESISHQFLLASFQSLSGFQVRCNFFRPASPGRRLTVFQSLSGFQVRCNTLQNIITVKYIICFNPYRVFKFVATLMWRTSICPSDVCFNPYRVFKFVATSELIENGNQK